MSDVERIFGAQNLTLRGGFNVQAEVFSISCCFRARRMRLHAK
jgi:hypothetical protein